MKSQYVFFFFILGILATLLSCGQPACDNVNPVFNQFAPETEQYKSELAKQLTTSKADELSFWFDRFQSYQNKEYIVVNIRGAELCAKGLLLVNDWKSFKAVRATRGEGYQGARLAGLKVTVKKNSATTELIATGVDRIVD